MTEALRVLIADDHPVFRSGLRALLENEDGFVVVGEAGTGAEAVTAAAELDPDVIVMDLHMPDLDGVSATRQILRVSPEVAVLVVTMFDDDDSVFAAMRAGARGYVLKGTNQADVVRAIQAVGGGGATFGPAIADRVVAAFSHTHSDRATLPQLSDREREVLDLVAQGCNNASISSRLFISEKTVRNHVSNIFTKLAVTDRAQAVVRAREHGLGGPSKS